MRSIKVRFGFFLAVLFVAAGGAPAQAVHTALDDYVAAPDASYGWSLYSTAPMYGMDGLPPRIGTIYTLKMTSQTWQSGKTNPDRSKWTHWISIARPYVSVPNMCLMIIDGGSVSSTPADISQYAAVSASLGISLAYLQYIPNEPLKFIEDGISRTEDSIIAYSYDKFLDLYGTTGEDDTWPLLLPMVKSAVRAMDSIQAFVLQQESVTISDFVIAGASKRGWTTWLTAAVDKRVKAMVPIVIDIVNMQHQLPHHKNSYSNYAPNDAAKHMYGGYSDAIKDYTLFNIFDRFSTTEGMALGQIVDPLAYVDRLTMPKLIVNSTGDQFFLPDGIKFYYNHLLGDNRILYVPNTDHGLGFSVNNLGTLYNILGFVLANVPGSGITVPKFDWSFQPDGSIRLVTQELPAEVSLWQAHVETYRDFRLQNVGAIWTSSPLADPDGDGVYVASIPQPATGWTGFYISVKSNDDIETCSGLRVIPDTYPNAAPPTDTWAPVFQNFAPSPSAPQTGAPVTLTFDASEALTGNPAVTVNGNAAVFQSSAGLSYTFTYTVLPTDPEGPAAVGITGTDLAENPGFTRYPNTLCVNNTALSIDNAVAGPALGGIGTEVVISFDASEAVHALPAVTVNGHAATFSTLSGRSYDYLYTIGVEDPEGFAAIQIAAVDFSGESVAAPFADLLSIDNVPPSYENLSAVPAFANEGMPVTLTFDVSEPLVSDPIVSVIGGGVASLQGVSGTSYTFTYTVGAAEAEGPVSVMIDGYDMLLHERRATLEDVFVIDRTVPAGLVAINGGAAYANSPDVTLTISLNDGTGCGVADMRFSEDGSTWSEWEPAASARPMTLSGADGIRTVYVACRDKAGNASSEAITDTIILDTMPPTGTILVNNNVSATKSTDAMLALAWDDGGGVGVTRMRFSNDGASWSVWEPLRASRAYTLPEGDGFKTVRVQYLDRAQNRSPVYNDYIRLDTVVPTGGILINDGALATTSLYVTLALNWADVGGGVTRMRFSDNGSTWTAWESQKATRTHTLPEGLGYHTVRVQYTDAALNYSAVYRDYIKVVAAP